MPIPAGVWTELSAISSRARRREAEDDGDPALAECLHLSASTCDHRTFRCADCCPHDD